MLYAVYKAILQKVPAKSFAFFLCQSPIDTIRWLFSTGIKFSKENNNTVVHTVISKMGMPSLGNIIDTTNTPTSYQHTILLSLFCFFPFFHTSRDTQINYSQNMMWWCVQCITSQKEEEKYSKIDMIGRCYHISNQLNDIKLMWEEIGHGVCPAFEVQVL